MKLIFIVFSFYISLSHTSTYYVPQDFLTIQDGIDSVELGDSIVVSEGVYNEIININYPLSLIGIEGAIIDGSGINTIININAYNVLLEGFEIIGDSLTVCGIKIQPGSENIIINNNIIHGMKFPNLNSEIYASYGILAFGDTQGPPNPPKNLTIKNNEIFDINAFGISLGSFTDSVLISNNFIHNIDRIDLSSYGINEDVSVGITGQFSGWVDIKDNIFSNVVLGSNFFFSYGALSNNEYDDSTRVYLSYNESNPISQDSDFPLPSNALSRKYVEYSGIGTLMSLHFNNIQDAIEYADNGSTIQVSKGTFYENINFNGKNIALIGNDELTTIDGMNNGSVVTFNSGENSEAILSNFIIRNGEAHFGGGISVGIDIESSPTIVNNFITNNMSLNGGGVYFNKSFSNFSYNVISENSATGFGGGIYSEHNGEIEITNCTIVKNSAINGGGGISSWSNDLILNSIIYFNSSSIDSSINGNNNQIISYSNISNYYTNGLGNISDNPLFVDLDNRDYTLDMASPCIDSGDPESPFDLDGTIADIGAYFYDQINNPIPVTLGDVNEDENINVLDIVMIVHFILNFLEPTFNQFEAADIDSSGTIDVVDIVLIIDIILDV